jgi:hypothetical protein
MHEIDWRVSKYNLVAILMKRLMKDLVEPSRCCNPLDFYPLGSFLERRTDYQLQYLIFASFSSVSSKRMPE